MDEILIDEKKYVSSKRAAKMTGYAKDYIGQLCREGRVPARLIGRSWYVLETAMQDHRFGQKDAQREEAVQTTTSAPVLSQTWESPRYEAALDEPLPSIHRPEISTAPDLAPKGTEEAPQHIEDSWRAWFEHVAQNQPTTNFYQPEENEEEQEEDHEIEKEIQQETREEGEVNVPINTIYDLPPKDLMPHTRGVERPQIDNSEPPPLQLRREAVDTRKAARGGIIKTIQIVSILLALATASVAVIGSGYFDKYVISSTQARIFTGVLLYSK